MMPYTVAIVGLGLMVAFTFSDNKYVMWPALALVIITLLLNMGGA